MICGKTIYNTKDQAQQAIDGINADRRPTKVNRKPRNTYWCDLCQGYHIHSNYKKRLVKTKSKTINSNKDKSYQPDRLIIRNFSSKPIK